MDEKYAKLIAKTRDGSLIAVYPEVQCDTEVDIANRTSTKPVANYAIADAISGSLAEAKSALRNAFLGSGLSWDDDVQQGSVNFISVSAEQAAALADKLVAEGGSVVLGSDGKLAVDFTKIPEEQITDVVESMVDPDGAIIGDPDSGKLTVDFSKLTAEQVMSLCSTNGGIVASTESGANNGKLAVDFSRLSAAQIMALCLAGGGIVSDASTGKLKIDFSAIDADTKRNITSSLKMQVPLNANKTVYVDNVNGSNTYLDGNGIVIEGKGETADAAFKSIQGAVNFVTEQWAMGTRSVNILLIANEDAPYSEEVTLPAFDRTTGSIHIKSADTSNRAKIVNPSASNRLVRCTGGSYSLQNIDLDAEYYRADDGQNHYPGLVGATSYGSITLYGCHCRCVYREGDEPDPKWFSLRLFASDNYGTITFGLMSGTHNSIEYHKNNASDCIVLHCQSNGKIGFSSASTDETITVDIPIADQSALDALIEGGSYSSVQISESPNQGNVLARGRISSLRSLMNSLGLGTAWSQYVYGDSLYKFEVWGECTSFCNASSASLVRYGSGANYDQFFSVPEGKAATGQRFRCYSLSCIDMGGMGGSFPGTTAGMAEAGAFAYTRTAVDGVVVSSSAG